MKRGFEILRDKRLTDLMEHNRPYARPGRAMGSLYPPLAGIRRISLAIATKVASRAYELRLARARRPRNIRRSIAAFMYEP